jgi:DNA-binding SARP family transcriptional activator
LLNRRHPHSREHLAAVFWGEYPTSTSRKYLRNTLWRLRRLLESAGAPVDEYLHIGDASVSFCRSCDYVLDIEAFETVATCYREVSGRELTAEDAAHLEEAIDLYAGDLLTGTYEDWCLYERERLNILYLNTLGKLMLFHELHGNYERGLAHGRRILACDNTRERVHRRMMRLYWRSGNRGAALAQYKLCAQILYEALGVSPLEETTRLYQQMKYGQYDPTIWADYDAVPAPVRVRTHESVPLLTEQALQRLHHLQTTIEQASAELRQIEQQLIRVLAGSWDSPPSTLYGETGGD